MARQQALPKRVEPFFMTARSILQRLLSLPDRASRVWQVLCDSFSSKTWSCWKSVRTLAREAGRSVRTVERSLAELVDAKLIKREFNGRVSVTTYIGPKPGKPKTAPPEEDAMDQANRIALRKHRSRQAEQGNTARARLLTNMRNAYSELCATSCEEDYYGMLDVPITRGHVDHYLNEVTEHNKRCKARGAPEWCLKGRWKWVRDCLVQIQTEQREAQDLRPLPAEC